jgi:hypothetical protein
LIRLAESRYSAAPNGMLDLGFQDTPRRKRVVRVNGSGLRSTRGAGMAGAAEQRARIEGAPVRLETIGRHPKWRTASHLGCLSVYRAEMLLCAIMPHIRRGL